MISTLTPDPHHLANTATVFEFPLFKKFSKDVRHGIFTREMNIENSAGVQERLAARHHPFSFSKQLHGTQAYVVKEKDIDDGVHQAQGGDVLITQERGIPLVISIADCASVLLYDPVQKIVANIHAGWRGLTQKVIHHTIQTMREEHGCASGDIFAAISPMLGPCCSHFSDPQSELPTFLHEYITGRNMVNLWKITEDALGECGVPHAQIENARVCTFCTPKYFYSYRRARGTPHENLRFGTAIMLI